MRNFQRPKAPHPAAHPLVHRIWAEIADQLTSQEDVAERAGVSSSAMRKWRKGERAPNLLDIEAVLNALGLEIVVRPIPESRR